MTTEREKLIEGLRGDSGDYGRRQGYGAAIREGELVVWDRRHVRAWEAAEVLAALRTPPPTPDAGADAIAAEVRKLIEDEYPLDGSDPNTVFALRESAMRGASLYTVAAALRTPPPVVDREAIARVLDEAGAQIGDCGHEPGDMDECGNGCRELLLRYADALFASGLLLSAGEHAAQVLEAVRDETYTHTMIGHEGDRMTSARFVRSQGERDRLTVRAREYREGTR